MKPGLILPTAAVAIVLILMLAGCGSGQSGPATSTQPSVPVSVAIADGPTHLGASETYQFTATVTNTADPRVAWAVSECASACGTITETGMYTAPEFVPAVTTVMITATSMADTARSASVPVPLMPVSMWLSPATALVLPGGTRSFTARMDHDSKHAGVTWALSGTGCSGIACGTLENVTSASVTYHAPDAEPNPHQVTLTATSITDDSKNARVSVTVSATPYLLEGKYAFLINGYRGGELSAIAGQFTADGKGNLTGVWDANRGAAAEMAQPITGTYNIQPDGIGSISIQDTSGTSTYLLSMDECGASGRFIEAAIPPGSASAGASGYMVSQNENYFTLSSIAGYRVVALYGEATYSHVAALGRFNGNAGAGGGGVMDLSWALHQNVAQFPNSVSLIASFTAPDAATGRGTAAFQLIPAGVDYHFVYYIVSDERLLLVQTDARGFNSGLLIPTLSGEIRAQQNAGAFTNASLNAPMVFHLVNADQFEFGVDAPMVRIGQMVPNSSGALMTTVDQNVGNSIEFSGPLITLDASFTGSYSVSTNGRVTWTMNGGPKGGYYGNAATIAYLAADNTGYFMTPDADGAAFGAFEPQTGGPFTAASIAGTYLVNTGPPANSSVENDTGRLTLASDGTLSGTVYLNAGSGATAYDVRGTFTVAENGRGTAVLDTVPPLAPRNIVFWMISPSRGVALSTVNAGDANPVLIHVQRVDGN
jgi:hypothetical protein